MCIRDSFQDRFDKGTLVSAQIKRNLNESRSKVKRINDMLGTDYPIEFNQARDKILERQLETSDTSDTDNNTNIWQKDVKK